MKYVQILLLTVTIYSCAPSAKECASMRTGHFTYTINTIADTIAFDVYRTDSLQVDVTNNNKDTVVYNVLWTKDCQYQLAVRYTNLRLNEANRNAVYLTTMEEVAATSYNYTSIRPDPYLKTKGVFTKLADAPILYK